jgi:hypothetical protein
VKKIQISVQRAVAEFAIIVLGVLAALAVDNWNQARLDADLESQYLSRLAADITDDIERLQFTLERADEKNNALEVVRRWRIDVDKPEELVDALRDSISLGFSLPFLNTATIEDLTNSGQLGLIRDTDLRQDILQYYRAMNDVTDRLRRRMTSFPGFVYSIVEPELRSEVHRVYADALSRCETTCALTLEAVGTPEFQRLATAEANYGQEIVEIVSAFLDRSEELAAQLRSRSER